MPSTKIIPAVEARTHLGEIMKQAFKQGKHFIVQKSGIEMIAIISANEYAKIMEEREERFKILNKIKTKIPDVPVEGVENDIAKAVKAVRRKSKNA